jgi:hypothetical protein
MTKQEAVELAEQIGGEVVFSDLTNEYAVDTSLSIPEISEVLQAEAVLIESK